MVEIPRRLQAQIDEFPGDLRIGVMNHIGDKIDYADAATMDPKIQISIHLSGYQRFYLDDELVEIDATNGPVGLLLRVDRPATVSYLETRQGPFRKIQLSMPLEWLSRLRQSSNDIKANKELSDHLDFKVWNVSKDIARLTDQVISPPPEETDVDHSLYRMSRGLEIFRRAIVETSAQPAEKELRRSSRTPEDIRLYIMANLSQDLSLNKLEDHFHINRRSLQRTFKAEFGVTLSDFIRRERLNKAHTSLKHYGMTITQVAHIAGYSSTANFTTAFRKEFGFPPSSVN